MKKKFRIYASLANDLSLVLNWLRLNKAVSKTGEPFEAKRGGYVVSVISRVSKKELSGLVRERFGAFAKVF